MEIILKSDDESSINEIIAIATNLNVTIISCGKSPVKGKEREYLLIEILNFKAKGQSSFGDALEWQKDERGN